MNRQLERGRLVYRQLRTLNVLNKLTMFTLVVKPTRILCRIRKVNLHDSLLLFSEKWA